MRSRPRQLDASAEATRASSVDIDLDQLSVHDATAAYQAEKTAGTTEARIGAGAVITISDDDGGVKLSATSNDTADTSFEKTSLSPLKFMTAASGAFAFSDTKVAVDGQVVDAASVEATAVANKTAEAKATLKSIGVAEISGLWLDSLGTALPAQLAVPFTPVFNGDTTAEVGGTTEARLGGGGNVHTAGSFTLLATSNILANSHLSVKSLTAVVGTDTGTRSNASGTTRVQLDEGAKTDVGTLTTAAIAGVTATAQASFVGATGFKIDGASFVAETAHTTEARTGPPPGSDPAGLQGTLVVRDGALLLDAQSTNVAVVANGEFEVTGFDNSRIDPEATAGGATRSILGGSFAIDADAVTARADSTSTATSAMASIQFGGVVVDQATRAARTAHTTEALVAAGAALDLGTAPLVLDADSDNDAILFTVAPIDMSAFNLALTSTTAEVTGETNAGIGEGVTIDAGSITATADSDSDADIASFGLKLNVIAGAETYVTATTDHLTAAFVGPHWSQPPAVGAPQSTITLGGPLELLATTQHNRANIGNVGIDIGVINGATIDGEARTLGATRAHIGGNAAVSASGVVVQATSTNAPTMVQTGFTLSLLGGATDSTFLQSDHRTEAYVGRDANFALSGAAVVELGATSTNDARIADVSVELSGLDFDTFAQHVIVDGSTRAFVEEGATLKAGGLVLNADSSNKAEIEQSSVSIGVLTVQNLKPTIMTRHLTEAHIGARAGTAVDPDLSTSVDVGSGTIIGTATSRNNVAIDAFNLDVSVVPAARLRPTLRVAGATRVGVGGGSVTLVATAVHFTADTLEADANAETVTVLIGGIPVTDEDSLIVVSHETAALVNADSTITVVGGPLTLRARTAAFARATSASTNIGVLSVATLDVRTRIETSTRSFISPGAIVVTQGGSVELLATSTATASAAAVAGVGGVLSVPNADARALVAPIVEAAIVNADVHATGSIRLEATSRRAEADAVVSAYGGGVLNVAAAKPTAASKPTVSAMIGSSAIVSAGEDIFVTATADAIGETELDDHFDASQVDTKADTISFAEHGLVTGDSVVYHPGSAAIGTPAGSLADGRSFGVVIVGHSMLHLGAAFMATEAADPGSVFAPGPGVDSARDIVRFRVPHQFETGDAVRYDPLGGGLVNAGLNSTDTYWVRVLDELTIKLALTHDAATAAPAQFTKDAVNAADDYLTLAGFANDQAVTYRAPATVHFTTEGIGSGSETIQLVAAGEDHGLLTGDRATYRRETDTSIGVGQAATVYVIRVSATHIALASSLSDANDDHRIDLDDAGADGDRHALVRRTIGLTTGVTYYVVNHGAFGPDTFQLSCLFCPLLSLTDVDVSGTHSLGVEGIELAPALGTHRLYIDFSSPGGDDQRLMGPEDVSLRVIAPPPGNGISQSSGRGGGGGVISSGNPNASTPITHTVNASVGGLIVRAGRDIVISALSHAAGTAYAASGSGGIVGVGDADARVEFANTNRAFVGIDDGGGIDASRTSLFAGRLVSIHATSSLNGEVEAYARSGGLISVVHAHSTLHVDGDTQAATGEAAGIHANTLSMVARWAEIEFDVRTRARSVGLFGGATAINDGIVDPRAEVVLGGGGAKVVAHEGADMVAAFEDVDIDQSSASSCVCIGKPFENHDDVWTGDMVATVRAQPGALLTVGPRVPAGSGVPEVDATPLAQPPGFGHLALYATAATSTANSNTSLQEGTREIDWNADLVVLAGPIPRLHVSSAGTITRAIGVTVNGGQNAVGSDVDPDDDGSFSVDDVLNDDPGEVLFSADTIAGGGSTWDFRDSFDVVEIRNESPLRLVLNDVDALNRTVQPFVDLRSTDAPGLTFAVVRSARPTFVEVDSAGAAVLINGTIENPIGTTSIVVPDGDVLATNDRDVPDGDGRISLVRTNILDIETSSGAVGSAATRVNVDVVDAAGLALATPFRASSVDAAADTIFLGRHQFFTGELVHYAGDDSSIGLVSGYYWVIVTPDGEGIQLAPYGSPQSPLPLDPDLESLTNEHTLRPEQRFTVRSPADIWLDVKGRLRTPSVDPPSSYTIIIDAVVSGGDTNILLRASVDESAGSGASAGIVVQWPGSAPASGQPYASFFRPDGPPANRDLGAFGAGPGTEIESTYEIGALDVFGSRSLPGIVSEANIIVAAANPSAAATLLHVRATVEIVGDVHPEGPGDEHHVDVLTNGNITTTELSGDLRVGAIVSTAHDVLLYATRMIVDALDDPGSAGADVAGENITMCAASLDPLSGTIADPGCVDLSLPVGGIGRPDNWLETDVDIIPTASGPALGVLRAFDITVDEPQTQGIFISEVHGNLNVHTVRSVRDVALNTLPSSGSIVDARNGGAGDDDPDVLGNNIDLDAAGGSIGNPDGSNDLEIDSFRGDTCHLFDNGFTLSATCDVALEADGSIFVTETDAALNLVLAHAAQNIRLTVRESSELDEDLNLLHGGGALLHEDPPDRPRAVLKGQIYAQTGYVRLHVGDDVTLDPHGEVLAGTTIDIYGDDVNADPAYGTSILVRGRIVAGCVVVSPTQCDPSKANPVHRAQLWGHTDVDTVSFGDASGSGFGTTPGDPGYVFIGSETRVHGGHNISSTDEADGEDVVIVWFLQSADVIAAPAGLAGGTGAGHSLTIDGQAGTDYVSVHTAGSHGAERNYVVNVLDTGAPDDGVDELAIYGFDNGAPQFNGYVPGTTTRNKTDDIFLLRATKCIDTAGPYGTTDSPAPTTCTSPTEVADRPAFVALLHGDDSLDGGLSGYRSRDIGDEASDAVQRINYDTALNGRLSVYGLGGNDAFFVDDNSAITTLDGGAGYDTFQIGQIFGLKRDSDEGALLAQDTFPELIATTRGWLSPGIHAPLVATGGTGNDEFVVYSNQAELRLEGDDDNDLFIVRAFALAAVCDTSADGDEDCDFADIDLEADPDTGNFPVDTNASGTCTAAENPGYDGEGWTGLRKDNNADGVCNKADAHITGAKTATTPADPTMWEDDVIPLDADGVARPVIGLGFSTARPLDIRAGGGEDEVSYNVNAPVSVDGGTGFDKVVILGTEFADDIVISIKGIFGAGLNVRYDNIEVVEVDGLEGDDEFFILSTKYGVAYRVIGGLGSDTINVAGDVVEDIVTRELEGVSGTIDHRVSSALDKLYDGLAVDGIDYNLATPDNGQIIIDDEGPDGTSVREGGSLSVPTIDKYSIRLASNPGTAVYVTISAARSAQEEADDAFSNPEPTLTSDTLADGPADTVWLCTGSSGQCDSPGEFKRYKLVNGALVDEDNRALVLVFDGATWFERQWVHVYAVDDARSEGDRVVVVQHSSISTNPDFDRVAVRNVEVSVRDNDTPGIYVTEITPGSCSLQCEEDKRTLTIEGTLVTGRGDELLVALQQDPGAATIRVKLVLDAAGQQAIELSSLDGRFQTWVHDDADPVKRFHYYTVDFDGSNWDDPILVSVRARDDAVGEDPQTAVIEFVRDDRSSQTLACIAGAAIDVDGIDYAGCDVDDGKTSDPGETYVFPNLRSGLARTAIEVIDDDTADVVAIESAAGTLVRKCGNAPCTIADGAGDWYTIRLTKRPTGAVDVGLLTDGMVDVVGIDGVAIDPADYEVIGGKVASRLFLGNLQISSDGLTLTRANGSDLGSFLDEGFAAGDEIRLTAAGIGTVDAKIAGAALAVADLVITLASALPVGFRGHVGTASADALSRLSMEGYFEGATTFVDTSGGLPAGGWQIVRSDLGSWLADGFLEGHWVEVCVSNGAGACAGTSGRYKIAVIRGDNETKDEKLELRSYFDLDDDFHLVDDLSAFGAGATVLVRRIAAVAHFTTIDWYAEQRIDVRADVGYVVPISRQGVKVFPVNTHGLWKLQGPLAVEGGVSGADRSLKLGLKLPGEKDGPLFKIGTQPPESKQIDVLNIFHDGSKEDGEGTMTSTTLSGFGLADDLDFGPTYSTGNPQTFGEPAIFPGGISLGSVQFVDGKFDTDGAKSTIEVVNVLLGIGNDELDVQGTLDPDDPVKLTGTIAIAARQPGTRSASDPGGVDITRPVPFDWKAQGFLIGQPVRISGFAQAWTVSGFSDDNLADTQDFTRMHLDGPVLTAAQIAAAPYEVLASKTVNNVSVGGGASGGSVVRAAGSWITDGFVVGQRVQLSGVAGIWTISTITNAGKTLVLSGGPALANAASATRTVSALVRTIIADDVPVRTTVPITIAGGDFGGFVTRTDGGSWLAAGFVEGQLVAIAGIEGSWRVRRIEGSTLRLERGSLLPTIATPTERTVFWPGPHGGLTVVHGGGNSALEIDFAMDTTASTLSRRDGRSWIDAGLNVGDRLQIGANGSQTRTVTGFVNSPCPYSDPFPNCGRDSTVQISGSAIAAVSNTPTAVHVAEPEAVTTTAAMSITVQPSGPLVTTRSTLTCAAACFSVSDPGHTVFHAGQQVHLSGYAGPFTITSVSATQMVLQGAALRPTYAIVDDAVIWSPVVLTVWGTDPSFDGGVRMGGDRIVVCNLQPLDTRPQKGCAGQPGAESERLAGPESPLVVYGDTSQDGVWYGGTPWDVKGYEFGPKPFDPFYKIPDAENEDDEWVFPLANPYDFAGNDVIDASNLFAGVPCASPPGTCDLPTVGLTAYGGAGDDLIIGSQTGDHLAGGSGDDVIFGLRGVDHIYGDSGITVDVLTRALLVATTNSSPSPSLDPLQAGRDHLYGEAPAAFGYTTGRANHTITVAAGIQSAFDDVIFGDHGIVSQQTADPNRPDTREQKIQTTTLASIRLIESRAYQDGGADVIFGNLGRDVLIGGAGHDMADGDEADDMVFGDNAFLVRRVVEAQFPAATAYAGPVDTTSGRFQALCGTLLYSRTDRPNACGGVVGSDTSGALLVNGVWQPYRDPDSPGVDGYPWWAEYLVDFDDEDLSHQFHSFDTQLSVDDPLAPAAKGAGSFGNDYLAGGQGHDLLFGQMGDDVIQGDGGIESAFAASSHVGASRSPEGCAGTPGTNLVCDYVGDLDVVPSFEDPADGEDYIEGGGGADVIFGGLGQDDIVGGSSDVFGLADELLSLVGLTVTISGLVGTWRISAVSGGTLTLLGAVLPDGASNRTVKIVGTNRTLVDLAVTLGSSLTGGTLSAAVNWAAQGLVAGTDRRPDGGDLIYGGAGTREDRADDTSPATVAQSHARDADTVVGDNGRIVRIVGTGGVALAPATATDQRYVRFAYDTYSTATGYDANGKIVVRGVTLLDYTPGGPDFDPAAFGLIAGTGPCSGAAASGVCSTPIHTCAGLASKYVDVGGRDEVHGESGDDTVYGGCGNDTIFGDAGDDDLVGGWGNDWISGGTGKDGVLGDDGRIFTSRNTGCAANNCWTSTTDHSEPLYGINKFLSTDPDLKVIHGYVLNEVVYTPGQVQKATINVAGALKKEVDVTPYNLGPNVDGQGKTLLDLPMYDANNSDDIIFGGFDDDFLHGASGDDAIGGGEALVQSYVQHFDGAGAADGLVRTDWTRPYNPGNLLLFGTDADPWNSPKPTLPRLGEFFLYDEYDPRRTVLFNADGTPWKTGAATANQYFLNLSATEGRATTGCGGYDAKGNCTVPNVVVPIDGNDVLFGDLGNDWLVGGTGRDDIWGGWGNDLSQADDVLTTNGSLNDVPETHEYWSDRVYGGAGLDILIGNTVPDRLIDWVGEWNTYLVPFNPNNTNTVSRQVDPQLPQFLYALSASGGADPTRDTDTGRPPARNGEYEGELGVVLQQDSGYWQQQTGGPTDPQPKNVQGGQKELLKGANFNGGTQDAFAVDSGTWEVSQGALSVGAASLGKDAAAVFYADEYLPVYFEVASDVKVVKPTAGWKANSYVIFDYFSPTDFKFAGINVATNKIEMGHRTATGWVVDVQSTAPVQIKPDTFYAVLVAINGTTVTVSVAGKAAFTYTFAARVVEGVAFGLNKGLVGAGSDNARGVWDNFAVQVLPPQLTLDSSETFDDGAAQQFTGDAGGAPWSVSAGRYAATAPAGETSLQAVDLGVERLQSHSYLELRATLRTSAIGGIVLDEYGADRFKFVALDVAVQRVIVGHVDAQRGWVVDASVARALTPDTDYALAVTIKGSSVSVTLDGAFVLSHAFNALAVDGATGVFTRGGTTSVDSYRLRTNDPAFTAPVPPAPSVVVAATSIAEGNAGTTSQALLTLTLSGPAVGGETVAWATANGSATAGSDYTAAAGSVTFAAGATSAQIAVTVLGDGAVEPDETFTVTLSNPQGLTLGTSTATLTITNDDTASAPSLSVADVSVTEGNNGTSNVTITVTLSAASTATVAVAYATQPGTAIAGGDYQTRTGALTFAPGRRRRRSRSRSSATAWVRVRRRLLSCCPTRRAARRSPAARQP